MTPRESRWFDRLQDAAITVWNAVMYKRPADPDDGITRPLRPRLVLRAWRAVSSLPEEK